MNGERGTRESPSFSLCKKQNTGRRLLSPVFSLSALIALDPTDPCKILTMR